MRYTLWPRTVSGFVSVTINGFSLIGRDSMTRKVAALLGLLISVNDELVNELGSFMKILITFCDGKLSD